MTVVLSIVVGVLVGVLTVAVIQIVRRPSGSERGALNEFAFFTLMAVLLTVGILVDAAVVIDLALIAAVVGYLSALSLARLLTRGGR